MLKKLVPAIGLVSVFIAGCSSKSETPVQAAKTEPPAAGLPTSNTDVQKLTLTVDNGFALDKPTVDAGKPIEITFDTKHRSCAKTVVFKSLGLTKELTDGTKTVVSLPAQKAGQVDFACGMDMLKGSVKVQ